MSDKTLTGKVRFAYVNVWEPKANENGDEKYSVTVLIPKKDKATLKKIEDAVEKTIQGNLGKWNGKRPAKLKKPLRDGDEDRPDSPEFAGMMFLNASTKMQPGIIDKDREDILERKEFYSGCWGRALLHFYAYNTSGNSGVGVGLNAVQKLEDGDRMSGSSWSADDFADGEDDIL